MILAWCLKFSHACSCSRVSSRLLNCPFKVMSGVSLLTTLPRLPSNCQFGWSHCFSRRQAWRRQTGP